MTNYGKSETDINAVQNNVGKMNISRENKSFHGKHTISFKTRKSQRVFLYGAETRTIFETDLEVS